MTDLSEFLAESPLGRNTVCRVALALERLDAERADKLRAALTHPDVTARAISRVVKGWGFDLNDQTVTRHRKGICRCH